MNATQTVLAVVATTLIVGAASYAIFRAVGLETRRRHLEVGTAIFLQAGVIYAVFLAFIFGQALTSYVAADDAISAECGALHGAAIIGHGLPAPQRAQLAQALDVYISTVLDREWAAMRRTRMGSPSAQAAEIALLEQANELDFRDAKANAVQARLIELLVKAHAQREERIFQAGQGIPYGLWVMVLVYCGILVALVFFSSLENAWSHAALSGVFGGLNAIVLLACFLLQYPFEGPFALSSTTFAATQARVQATLGE